MKKKASPRFDSTERIGVAAVERIFLERFRWIPRSQKDSDMGVDLQVEVSKEGTPTGRLLALQVKCGKSYWERVKKGAVVFKFRQTHYEYWTRYSLPVLIVLHHPQSKKTIWQHICPKTCVSTGKGWRIHIPLTQDLSVEYAEELASLAKKPSLPDAIRAEEERIESLDPRFRAQVVAFRDETRTFLRAVEDVRVTLHMTGSPEVIEEKYRDLVERGKPVTFEKEEIRWSGSPLFERATDDLEGEVTIQAAWTRPVAVSLLAIGAGGKEEAGIHEIPATATGGTKGVRIAGGLKNSPLTITMEASINADGRKGTVLIDFDPEAWLGRELLGLPYFDQIHRLFEALENGAKLALAGHVEGNKIFEEVLGRVASKLRNGICLTELLGRARFIARRLGVSPALPELSIEQVHEVEVLYRLLQEGEVTTNVAGLRFAPTLSLAPSFLDLAEIRQAGEPFQIALNTERPQSMPFLGKEVEVGRMLIAASSVLLSNRETVQEKLRNSDGPRKTELVFEGTDQCTLTRKIQRNVGG